MSGTPAPRATYRLQLHKDFQFADAAALAPYLARLGISHVYLSPILKARAASLHGYDTVDHAQINPELGSRDDFRAMAEALRAHGIGIILDIVPNHMGVGGADNPYWLDVLRLGEGSRYASWFDIDWHPPTPGLDGKLLVPLLGKPFAEALEGGEIELRETDGEFAVWAHDHHKLPLSPGTAAGLSSSDIAGLNADKSALARLIAEQHWQLAKASAGDDEINYRRFFIVSELAAIRIELPEVFAHVHRIAFELIGEGLVEGLRIDHVDGLLDPAGYCRQVRESCPRPIYLLVEKILGEGEKLRASWHVDGTTGYEFAAVATPLLVDPAGELPLTAFYRELCGASADFPDLEWAAKCEMMDRELAAELEALSWRFVRAARRDLEASDLSRLALKRALRGFVAALPIYRTYVDAEGACKTDRAVIDAALAEAARREPWLDGAALAFIGRLMRRDLPGDAALAAALRLQQVTGPVMAKGLEDTALYRHNRLIALNDVGERPNRFSLPIAEFHAANRERFLHAPHGMLGSSSHDSKRGEDARCRIAALSGAPAQWIAAVPNWLAALERAGAPRIDSDDAYHFFQLLLGAWPGETSPAFAERMVAAMRKSLREARLRTSWTRPDTAYEADVEAFIGVALDPERGRGFLGDFLSFEAEIGPRGALNGLIETTLKLTAPGVPDIYQGADLWEQSMVDPDNRRPVDFAERAALLDQYGETPVSALFPHWRDGAVKQSLIATLLHLRREHAALFAEGSYEPLIASGPGGERVCAFARGHEDEVLLVAARLFPGRGPGEARVALPQDFAALRWRGLIAEAPSAASTWPQFEEPLPIAVALGTRP
jgi:(1->4)-alpha-D-glucan 1-alpha-D-glucosylmutase